MSTVLLSEIAEIQSGVGFPTKYQGMSKGDYPFAKVGDISAAKRAGQNVISTANNYVSSEICKKLRAKPFPKNTIVFAKIGEAIRNGNKVVTDRPMIFDNNVMGISGDERRVFPKYLYRYLDKINFYNLANSTTVPSIRKADMATLEVWLPPLDEQKRIAAILDQADDLRCKRRRALDRLDQLGQAVFHEMFGSIATKPRTHSFADIATIQQSLVDPKLPQYRSEWHVGPEHIQSGKGSIRWENVRTAHEDNIISGKNKFTHGDVIYSKIRPNLNKVAIADRSGLCSADMYVIQAVPGASNARFLHLLLMGEDFLSYAETCSNRANIPKLNRKQLEGYQFYCPPIEEQHQLALRLKELERAEAFQREAEVHAASLFASLQHRAFRGEL